MTTTAAAYAPFVPRTKLRPPRLPDDLLRRPRLIEKLDRPQALSLVIAPAGYGKTALVSTWLAQCGLPYGWLSLEPDDNTFAAFLAGFAAAVHPLVPDLDGKLRPLLQAQTGEPDVRQAIPVLLNTLDGLEERFVVVLDDYHHVRNAAIHQLIYGLLEHPPRALQLVLTARCDPPLPPRLRYSGSVTETRARELGFTEQEAQAFLEQFVAEPIAAQAVAGLVEKTEGWAVPLRLAAMLISQRQDAGVLDQALQICERSLLDYLDAEVIGHLPGDVQTFLARTSILNVLSASLCEATLGRTQRTGAQATDSIETLRMLADNGVFVEQLDEAGGWFRYQELFRYLLQRRLLNTHSAEEIDAFTQRAKVWQEQHVQSDAGREGAGLGAGLHERYGTWTVPPPAAELRTVRRAARPPTAAEQASTLLTYREMDVLTLLCERLTNKEIASRLGIATETVRQHSVHLYRKLGVAGRRQAIVQARAMGLPVSPVGGVQAGPHYTSSTPSRG